MLQFPDHIAFGAQASLRFENDITTLSNGREIRNRTQKMPRRHYNIATGLRTLDDLNVVVDFFTSHGGTHRPFLFRDIGDFKSCSPSKTVRADDQFIAVTDGKQKSFQLQKSSVFGEYARSIHFPIAKSVRVTIEDQDVFEGQDFNVAYEGGVLKFHEPPEAGAQIFAGFEYLVCVRFENDDLDMLYDNFDSGNAINIGLIELPYEVAS